MDDSISFQFGPNCITRKGIRLTLTLTLTKVSYMFMLTVVTLLDCHNYVNN